MEAVSRHLELFSAGLFEEVLQLPYYVDKKGYEIDLMEKRRKRLKFVADFELTSR
jgi:hypothetical protein